MGDSLLVGECLYCELPYCMICSDAEKWSRYCSRECQQADEVITLNWRKACQIPSSQQKEIEAPCPNTVYHYHVGQGIEPDGKCWHCQKKEVTNESTQTMALPP